MYEIVPTRPRAPMVRQICANSSHIRCRVTISPSPNGTHRNLIRFVTDRPGHDRRYAIDASKLERELDWRAEESFETGIRKTVRWYVDEQAWWRGIAQRGYPASRIGLST